MYTLRVLNSRQTEELLDMPQAVDDVERAYRLFAKGEAGVFPVIVHQFEKGVRETDIKSGHISGAGLFGLKILGFCSENTGRDQPHLAGLIVVMDYDKQQPIGILDGTPITFFRTGAAGGVAAKTFARKDSKKALIIGAGNQGRAQLMGIVAAMPGLREIYISDILNESALKFVEAQRPNYPNLNLEVVYFEDLPTAARGKDIIVTCTRAREAFLRKEWVSPGTHINAIGADMPGKQEIDTELMRSVKLFGDMRTQVVQKGETQHIAKLGLVTEGDVAEIGEVLEGIKPGRISDDEITVFDATGMAIQDLIVSGGLLEKAKNLEIGTKVEF